VALSRRGGDRRRESPLASGSIAGDSGPRWLSVGAVNAAAEIPIQIQEERLKRTRNLQALFDEHQVQTAIFPNGDLEPLLSRFVVNEGRARYAVLN
jgi:hypothetical protein